MTPRSALPILESVDAAFARGPAVPCQPGCSACCRGPFDISPADALLVAEGMERLDRETRAALERRAAAQLMTYRVVLPGWHAPHDVADLPEDVFDHLADLLRDVPCPALDAAGRCVIYTHRPATCRLMGRAWVDDAAGDVLGNGCPIEDQFPGYANTPPAPLSLAMIEDALDALDSDAATAGHVSTTIAGAVAAQARRHRAPD